MKTPVFRFGSEILTDAPLALVAECLATPDRLRCLKPLGAWSPVQLAEETVGLRWERAWAGALETGQLTATVHPRGAHLRLEGQLRGWAGFLCLGLLRWRTDRLLDRLVEEL